MTTANEPDAAEGAADLGSVAADLTLFVWCNCIQKDAIISNKPEIARIFRSVFTCDLRVVILPHISIARQET